MSNLEQQGSEFRVLLRWCDLIASVRAHSVVLVDYGHNTEIQQLCHNLLQKLSQSHKRPSSGWQEWQGGADRLQIGAAVCVAEVEGCDEHLRRGDIVSRMKYYNLLLDERTRH